MVISTLDLQVGPKLGTLRPGAVWTASSAFALRPQRHWRKPGQARASRGPQLTRFGVPYRTGLQYTIQRFRVPNICGSRHQNWTLGGKVVPSLFCKRGFPTAHWLVRSTYFGPKNVLTGPSMGLLRAPRIELESLFFRSIYAFPQEYQER